MFGFRSISLFGATLDQATNDFLAELHSGSAAWVGGTDAVAEGSPDGSWIWTDGTPWHYTSWAPGQPNHKHGQDYLIFSDGSWNDLKNSNKRTFFCQYTGETEICILLILGIILFHYIPRL